MLAASFFTGLFFWTLTILTCGFAALFGGRDGRWFAVVFFASTLLTMPALLVGSWQKTQLWLAMVDTGLLIALIWLMLRSSSYWPIWAAASQLLTVLTHAVTLLLHNFVDKIYESLSTVWVIPLLLVTLIGIELDRKASHDRAQPA